MACVLRRRRCSAEASTASIGPSFPFVPMARSAATSGGDEQGTTTDGEDEQGRRSRARGRSTIVSGEGGEAAELVEVMERRLSGDKKGAHG